MASDVASAGGCFSTMVASTWRFSTGVVVPRLWLVRLCADRIPRAGSRNLEARHIARAAMLLSQWSLFSPWPGYGLVPDVPAGPGRDKASTGAVLL